MIRVLVADDDHLVRAGLETLLKSADDLELLASAKDGESAIALAAEHQPDVVLVDLSMPGIDGVEATRRITDANLEARVLVLTAFSDQARIVDALDAGAVGYVLKDLEGHELLDCIRVTFGGGSPLDPKVARALLATRNTNGRAHIDRLTGREREVLTMVAEGMANKQIARRLGISEKTVKTHLGRVFQRIGVSDRTQAALWAQRNGLLDA